MYILMVNGYIQDPRLRELNCELLNIVRESSVKSISHDCLRYPTIIFSHNKINLYIFFIL